MGKRPFVAFHPLSARARRKQKYNGGGKLAPPSACGCMPRAFFSQALSLYIILIARGRGRAAGQLSKSNRAALISFSISSWNMRRLICAFFSFGHTRLDAVYFVSGHFPRVDLWILSLSLLPLWLHLIYELRAHTHTHRVLHEILLLNAILWKSGF